MPAIDTKHGKPAKKVRRPRKPSSTSIAKAQEQQYASQGAAVNKQAKAQVKVRVRSQQLARSKHAAGDAPQTRAKDTQRAQSFVKGEYQRQAASDKARGIVKSPRIKAPYRPGTTVPPDVAERAKERGTAATHKAALAGRVAPVLKVLDQTTRPLHAIAGAANEDVKVIKARGVKNYLVHGAPKAEHAAKRGIQNKDHTTFSDVLKTAGVKNKAVRGVAGFGLDVALDPTSYVLGGTGSVAAREAAKEAARVEAKAAAKGLTADQAKRMGDRAAAQATKKAAGKGSGVTVKIAGQELPGVRGATAAAGRGAGKATRKVVPRRAREGARSVAADVNPNVTPADVEKATSQAATRATRRARAESNQGTRAAVDVAHGIRKQIGEKNYAAVVDAIEAQSIKSLPEHLRPHAVALRSQLRHVRRVQRRAGVKVPERKGYVPRQLTDQAAEAEGKATSGGVGQRVIKPKSSKGRTETRPMKVLREEKPGRYREDLHALVAERLAEGATSSAKATLNRTLGDLGRAVKRGQELTLGKGESVYHVKGSDIRQVTDQAELAKIVRPLRPNKVLREGAEVSNDSRVGNQHFIENRRTAIANAEQNIASLKAKLKAQPNAHMSHTWKGDLARSERNLKIYRDDLALATAKPAAQKAARIKGGNTQGGRFVVLPDEVVKRAVEGSTAALQGPGIVHAFDKVTGGFKRLALATPGFHIRNLVGDTSQAYLGGQNPARLARNMGKAAKVTHELGKQQKAARDLGRPKPSGKTLKTGKYGHVSYEDIAHNLVGAGAARSGYTAGELRELSKSGEKGLRITRPKAPAGVKRAFLNREDIPRLATAIHALQQGATWEEAAQRVADIHFDYQHLSSFERNIARRILPFYTWSARNIPFQAKNIVKRPGKYAAYQKVLEEAGKASQPDRVKQDPKQVETLYTALKRSGVKLPGDWRRYLSEWEQRNAGVPVNLAGGHFTLSAGLPIADLNEFPGAAGKGQLGEYGNRVASLVNPIIKDPIELWANYSAYFRDQIQRDRSPLVAAPSFVAPWPNSVKKKLGVVQGMDSKSGKTVWKWPGKVDYVSKNMLPGLGNQAQQLMTQGADRRGRGPVSKAAGVLGLKSVPVDPVTNAVNLANARQHEIDNRLASLREQINPANGRLIGAKNPTQEYQRLSQQNALLSQVIYAGLAMRGFKKLPTRGGPPKVRGSVSGRGTLGGSGGSLGGSGKLGGGGTLGGAGTLG